MLWTKLATSHFLSIHWFDFLIPYCISSQVCRCWLIVVVLKNISKVWSDNSKKFWLGATAENLAC